MLAALFPLRPKAPDGKPPQSAGARCATSDLAAASGVADPTQERSPRLSAGRAAGERAILNTAYRSGGEMVGRLSSLLLFAYAGRKLGQNGLGAFVFAIAFTAFVMIAVDLGLDRYSLRAIAKERSSAHHLFFNVIVLKIARAVPLFLLSFVGLHFVGYSSEAQATAWVLAPGVFCDSIARTQLSLFAAHERNGPPAAADTIQRVLSALLGIIALKLGYGVVAVGATYSIGSFSGVVIGFVLMTRTIGVPARAVSHRRWRALSASAFPFAVQDLFTSILAMLDTLILSLLATQAAVGRYGAAYRLFESTLFISYALVGAFSAMYTYLRADSDPPINTVYQRSVKLAVTLLMPLAVAFVVLARPICRLIYGPAFGASAVPLRILGPGVVLFGFVTLSVSLLISRRDPRRTAAQTATIVALNMALNFTLIPILNVAGAATAMLATEVVFAVWIARRAIRVVGRIQWLPTTIGALCAGVAMATVALPLHDSLPAALAGGLAAYLAVLLIVDWLIDPFDVLFVVGMIRRRLFARSTM
jgi:O-antigen/teichoic acid export membrane protein